MKELHYEMVSKENLVFSLHSKLKRQIGLKDSDYEALGKHSDFCSLMCYDKNPVVLGPKPNRLGRRCCGLRLNRIPANKVVLGIGAYGYGWTNTGGRTTWFHTRNEVDYRIKFINETIKDYNIRLNGMKSLQWLISHLLIIQV